MNTSATTPLLAVIVPVYKVEPYLRQCLDSICSQSYTTLKILLIDDGSPDSCGAICDEYARLDPRIQVIHQPNRGLSAARNTGLAHLGGCPYFTFVDSDDWLESTSYAPCIELLEQDPALDLVQFGYRCIASDGTQSKCTQDRLFLSRDAACKCYIEGGDQPIAPAVWNKVYRSARLASLRFREGYPWEDLTYTLEALFLAKQVRLLEHVGINYRLAREGAITDHFTSQDMSPLFANVEYFIDQHVQQSVLVGYANALLLNQLWTYWSLLNTQPKRYQELYPRYLPFVQRARRRPFPQVFSRRSTYLKRLLLLYAPTAYMGLRAKLRERRLHRQA